MGKFVTVLIVLTIMAVTVYLFHANLATEEDQALPAPRQAAHTQTIHKGTVVKPKIRRPRRVTPETNQMTEGEKQ